MKKNKTETTTGNKYMKISQPTKFNHLTHVVQCPCTGKFIGLPTNLQTKNELQIATPTNMNHIIHVKVDEKTGRLKGIYPDVWIPEICNENENLKNAVYEAIVFLKN